MLELNPHLRQNLPADTAFDWLLNCDGKVHRHVKHRRTLEFELGGRRYFIKIHRGCSWGEIFNNLLQARLPVVSAEPEWTAIDRLRQVGIRTPVTAGKGIRGRAPTQLESFIVTEALEGMVSLEKLVVDWGGLRGQRQKQLKCTLITSLAQLARVLHGHGMNHRDFYLCHFLVSDRDWRSWDPGQPMELVLIDLHRVQIRSRIPSRWIVKDLGGLLFSALDCGLTSRDLLRFIQVYRERPWREVLAAEKSFWQRVWSNAIRLYRRHHGREADVKNIVGQKEGDMAKRWMAKK